MKEKEQQRFSTRTITLLWARTNQVYKKLKLIDFTRGCVIPKESLR